MSIYQETPSSAFPLPVTESLNQQLGFTCNTVIVDNYTNQYLYFPDIARYVPPSTFGAVLPYRPMNSVRATFAPPPGILPATINASQSASVTALQAQVPPSPGVSTNTTFNIDQGSVNANIVNSTLDTHVTGGNVDVSGTVDATVSGSVNATITGGTVDATITNSTIDATITNSQVDINNVTPNIEMSALASQLTIPTNGAIEKLGTIPVGSHIRGWTVSSSVLSGNVAIYFGPSTGPGFQWWQGALQANTPHSVIFSPGLSISAGLNQNSVWCFSSAACTLTLVIYYSAT